jgi:hypothetical protein
MAAIMNAVANAAGSDRRIDLHQLVAMTVGDSPAVLWALRLVLGLAAAICVLILTGHSLGLWSFVPATAVGVATTWKVNSRRLLQIGAEISGLSSPSAPGIPELTEAHNIRPGDWAFPADRYEKMRQEAERQHRLALEVAERRRSASGPVGASQSDDSRLEPKVSPVPLGRVMATAESQDKRWLTLRFANGDACHAREGQEFYRYRPKSRQAFSESVKKASPALGELLNSLASGSESENDLITSLEESHSESSVHRALRTALSQRLVQQDVGLGRTAREIGAAFSRNMDARLRQRSLVSLSPGGDAWVQGSAAPEAGKAGRKSHPPRPAPGAAHYYVFGDLTFTSNTTTGRGPVHADGEVHGTGASGEQPAAARRQPAMTDSESSDNLTVAWSAGVSATGAGLAALLANGPAPWQRALLLTLIFVSGCTFIILILAGVPSLTTWWHARRRRLRGHDPPAHPEATKRSSS